MLSILNITGTMITGVRLLNVIGSFRLMEENRHIECQYCFGAEELTSNGRLFVPCPVCKGGKLSNEDLIKANKKWLKQLKDDLDSFKEEE
jgi:Zn finger protein HypA/HybF involved in hydrogenase expression